MRSLVVVALLGCGGSPPPAPLLANIPPTPAPISIPVVPASCAGDLAFHRETLVRGRETEIAAMGHRATYQGEQRDHFDEGRSEVLISLELFGQAWLPDAGDRGVHAFGEHCVRIVDANATQVVLDVALQPAHAYDPHRCHLGCCASEARSRTPDGNGECCFCADDPTP